MMSQARTPLRYRSFTAFSFEQAGAKKTLLSSSLAAYRLQSGCGLFILGDNRLVDTRTRDQRSRIMASVHQRNTGPELAVRRLLFASGYRFRIHRRDLPGTPDVVFPSRRAVIFVHGCFWHGHDCPKGRLPKSRQNYWQTKINANRKRDAENVQALASACWKVLVVWQCELQNQVILLEKLNRFLAQTNEVSEDRGHR